VCRGLFIVSLALYLFVSTVYKNTGERKKGGGLV
jgi:hypothetical protein